MKAMILAAGRGTRMGALTDNTPKPLLSINGVSLIENNLYQLKKAGITDVVINVCYLAEKIMERLGDGSRYGMNISYSLENELLDTGGGIKKALPQLGTEPFLLLSSDIWSDYPFENLMSQKTSGAHLVLVDNPKYHAEGDFGLVGKNVVLESEKTLTYSSIAVIHPAMFSGFNESVFSIAAVFKKAIKEKLVTGEHYNGTWFNVGTPDELRSLDL